MLTEERFQIILNELEKNKSVTLTALIDLIGASESTVRRDLNSLAKMGRIKKVHGGAVAIESDYMRNEPNVTEKQKLNGEEKDAIAKYAASTIRKNDFVFIDAGTTTERMIKYITEKDAKFVTNGFNHAHSLAKRGFNVFLTGGEVKPTTEAIIGTGCVETISKFNFTKCYMGTNGISEKSGFTTHNLDEAAVKSTAVERSYITYVLADYSKFDKVTAVSFAPISKACIITDRVPDEKYNSLTIIKEVLK